MPSLPARFAPHIYGIVQSAVTTGIATAIATAQLVGFSGDFLRSWPAAWAIAWLAMLPVVVVIAPFIQIMVRRLIAPS